MNVGISHAISAEYLLSSVSDLIKIINTYAIINSKIAVSTFDVVILATRKEKKMCKYGGRLLLPRPTV